MWNERRSLLLSKICTILFMLALVAVLVGAPWLAHYVIRVAQSITAEHYGLLLATVYTGAVPAGILLFFLYRLLHNLGQGQVFTMQNVAFLRHISWCCFAGAGISLLSTLYYSTWGLVAVAAAFMGLIVRVVKNILAQATVLKEENDLTV